MRSSTARPLLALVLAAISLACGSRAADDRVRVTPDDAPAAAEGASTPFLTTAPDGTLWMSWMEPAPDSSWRLRVAHRAADGAWSAPLTAVEDPLLFANWADFPSVAVDARGRLVAHVLRRSAPGKYSYHVWVTSSTDGGATWSAPQRLHRDTSATEHGFVALVADTSGVDAAWLDGHGTGGAQGAMSVAFGGVDAGGRVRADTMLDTRTCDCCQVAGARIGDGVLFAYRDRSAEEVRDIAVVRYQHGSWSPPTIVHADGWVTTACPVNGPALAARDHRVALAWFTKARDTAKVQLAFSTDDGASWSAPQRVDDGAPLGRVDVELLADGRALVVWMEQTGTGHADIRARVLDASGPASRAFTVHATSDARQAGFPRIALQGDRDAVVAWRDIGPPAHLRLARLSLAPAPARP